MDLDDPKYRQSLRAIPIALSVFLDCCVVGFMLITSRLGAQVFSVVLTRLFGLLIMFDVASQMALLWIEHPDKSFTCRINSFFLYGGFTGEFASSACIAYIILHVVGFPGKTMSSREEVTVQVLPVAVFFISSLTSLAGVSYYNFNEECWFHDPSGIVFYIIGSVLALAIVSNIFLVLVLAVRLSVARREISGSNLNRHSKAGQGLKVTEFMGKLSARMAIYPFSVTVFGVGGFVGYAVFGNSGLAHLLRGCLLALTGVVNSLAFFLLDPSAGTMARQALSVSPDSLNRLVPLKRLLMWMAGVSASDVSMPTSSEASRVPPSSMS